MARYALLPYWYTLFYYASVSGTPTMRPLWFEYPTDESTFSMDDQWLVGADLVVKPVTSKGATRTEIYLPGRCFGSVLGKAFISLLTAHL